MRHSSYRLLLSLCSCESGISRSAVGMLGKVWSSGALAVVQNVAIIPTCVHPRNKLDGATLAAALVHCRPPKTSAAPHCGTCSPCICILKISLQIRISSATRCCPVPQQISVL